MTAKGSWETRHDARGRLSVHRHHTGYAALVLEGRYDERSVDGRFTCEPGTVVVHPAHHLHANDFGERRVRVLNIPLPDPVNASAYRVVLARDPGQLERLMRVDPSAAAGILIDECGDVSPEPAAGWLLRLANRLRDVTGADASASVAELARSMGRSPEHASRAFTRQFGVGPCAYRREHRLRRSLDLIRSGSRLVEAAQGAGFADQSHLGRELKRATGLTPRRMRPD